MPFKRKRYRRKRRRSKKTSFSKVRSMIRKEVGKTRETKKLVSFVMDRPVRTLNTDLVGTPNTPFQNTVVYSLTGGRVITPSPDYPQDPNVNTEKSLFGLRPMFANSNFAGVDGYGEGGIVDDASNVAGSSLATQGIHQLQGKHCFLKKWYCNLRINNQGTSSFNTPSGTLIPGQNPVSPIATAVRVLIVETRRPLGNNRPGAATTNSLAEQLFLQYHAGDGTNQGTINADSVNGFLNLSVIKKVMYDKLIWLGDGDKGSSKSQFITRLKIPLNRKAYWNHSYATGADPGEGTVSYQGPWIYLIALNSNQVTNSLEVCPRLYMSSILTFLDD